MRKKSLSGQSYFACFAFFALHSSPNFSRTTCRACLLSSFRKPATGEQVESDTDPVRGFVTPK
jgi:hypothetical protein